MKIIGLTGPTGSGKSTVAAFLKEQDFAIIDCDLVAREVVEKGSPLLEILSEAFGSEILNSDGTLNRKELAKRAFCDKGSTELLNSIMLPFIAERINEQLALYADDGVEAVVLDAPTLFESGLDSKCDAVIAVLCDREIRKQRIIKRDGLTESQAETRLMASKPDPFYKERTRHIVFGDGTVEKTQAAVKKIIGEIL